MGKLTSLANYDREVIRSKVAADQVVEGAILIHQLLTTNHQPLLAINQPSTIRLCFISSLVKVHLPFLRLEIEHPLVLVAKIC